MRKVNLSFGMSLMLALLFLIGMSSCKKEFDKPNPEPKDDGVLVDVSFAPTLNGEVVPWLSKSKAKSGKGDGSFSFTHRYTAHIIRVISGNGPWSNDVDVWVMDIPLIPQNNGTGTDTFDGGDNKIKLPKGNFQCRVLPINVEEGSRSVENIVSKTNADLTKRTPYEVFMVEDELMDATFDMASFESNNVPFAIVTSASQTIPMKLFTRQALMLLDLGNDPGWTYEVQKIEEPLLQFVVDGGYLGGSANSKPYTLPYATLNSYHSTASPIVMKSISPDGAGYQYFKYFVPGLKSAYTTPGVNTFQPIAKATYLRFGNELAGTSMPAVWLRDYWNDGELRANMVVRMKYSIGTFTFTTERLSWFGDKVDIIDGDIPATEPTMTIAVTHTPFTGIGTETQSPLPVGYRIGALTATVTGGTGPYIITWWNNSSATDPAMDGFNHQIFGEIGYPFAADLLRFAKATDIHDHSIISSPGLASFNDVLGATTFTSTPTSITATGNGGIAPYTFRWFNAAVAGTLLQTDASVATSTLIHGGQAGLYYVEITSAAGQLSGRVLAGVVVPTPLEVGINQGVGNTYNAIKGGVLNTGPWAGYTYVWSTTSNLGLDMSYGGTGMGIFDKLVNAKVKGVAGNAGISGSYAMLNGTFPFTVTLTITETLTGRTGSATITVYSIF